MTTEFYYDVDAELDAWHEAQGQGLFVVDYHRCPIDQPPCLECQELDDEDCAE